jgi:putative oxidoreductase
MELGLLLLRVVLGATIAAHGAQKLFGWFGGFGIEGTAGWLGSMGFRSPKAQATLSGLSELGGGLLLALGLLTPLGAAAVAGVMIVAIATVHISNGFFNGAGGYEFNLLIVGAAIALAITGPGSISLDHALGIDLAGPEWGAAALLLALASAGAVLGSRRPVPAAEEPQLEQQAA